MDTHSIDTSQYLTEGYRIKFYLDRDGFDETIKIFARMYKMYRLALRHGMARDKLFRRSYVTSCMDIRKLLRIHAPSAFKNTLVEIFYA